MSRSGSTCTLSSEKINNFELNSVTDLNNYSCNDTNLTPGSESDLECYETLEIQSKVNKSITSQEKFKLPIRRKRKTPAASIVLGNNITLNLFTIFCSLALVASFLCITF